MPEPKKRGRPRTKEGPHSEGQPQLQTRIDRAVFAKIQTLAANKGQTVPEWTRQAVLEKVELEEQTERPVRPP